MQQCVSDRFYVTACCRPVTGRCKTELICVVVALQTYIGQTGISAGLSAVLTDIVLDILQSLHASFGTKTFM